MARRTETFLKEYVVLFGFLNGLWLAIGVNPGERLFGVAQGIVDRIFAGTVLSFLFATLPLAILVVILALVWRKGGWLGFAAVGTGFLAGIQVLGFPELSFALLLVAMLLGWLATKR